MCDSCEEIEIEQGSEEPCEGCEEYIKASCVETESTLDCLSTLEITNVEELLNNLTTFLCTGCRRMRISITKLNGQNPTVTTTYKDCVNNTRTLAITLLANCGVGTPYTYDICVLNGTTPTITGNYATATVLNELPNTCPFVTATSSITCGNV
jgi:hypothetical protein